MPDERSVTPADEHEERAIYEAAKVHMRARGIDPTGPGVQQALVPDEFRWMRAAIVAYKEALDG